MATASHLDSVIIESDNQEVIKLAISEQVPPWETLAIFLDIRHLARQGNLQLPWTPRSNNRAAHWVAQAHARNELPVGWASHPPLALDEIVMHDASPVSL
ncbi:hypothetical protein LOK49_LG05G02220 [Camellia lanceoleosa]|uniref:Uncharacterized protein n=1 Tax=Camellia lanceoleosa TaxID=1840588 RepID=A0ACC0HX94_9ERIC|nr:hypothetical protein LOK49_LG05G02220 [Camellia lanceoleosa]